MTPHAKMSDAGGDPKIAGVMVTFFPGSDIRTRLGEAAAHTDALIIVDNSASDSVSSLLKSIAVELDARLVLNARNVGVATALNRGVEIARSLSATHVCFFDQDSALDASFGEEMRRTIAAYDDVKPLGILGANFIRVGESSPTFPVTSANGKPYLETTNIITSGSLYDIRMMSALGTFRDDYFIDSVDTEYCWRALRSGYAVCRTTKPLMHHGLGTPTSHCMLGLKLSTLNYSPLRRYLMTRNAVLVFREYLTTNTLEASALLAFQFKNAFLIAAFERDKAKKLSSILRGLWHGITGNMTVGVR
jgi:rhamnosyltransferase